MIAMQALCARALVASTANNCQVTRLKWNLQAKLLLILGIIQGQIAFAQTDKTEEPSARSATIVGEEKTVFAPFAKPAEKAFEQIFDSLTSEPKERDYAQLLDQIHALCTEYPGSDPAYRSIFAVERWLATGLINFGSAQPIIAMRDKFNPADSRLREIGVELEKARGSRNREILRNLAAEYESISREHANTVAEFLARGSVGQIYYDIGDVEQSKHAIDRFLEKFPPGSVEYPSSDVLFHVNCLLRAKLGVQTESLEKGLKFYEDIAKTFSDQPAFVIPALFDAGSAALGHERPEKAIAIFSDLTKRYDGSKDERIIIAEFRMAQAEVILGAKAKAIKRLRDVAIRYPGQRWEKEALSVIESLQTQASTQQANE